MLTRNNQTLPSQPPLKTLLGSGGPRLHTPLLINSFDEPGPFDVICSQGKMAKTHAGNIYFQSVIQKSAKQYANAFEKRDKSNIVSEIIATIQIKSRNTGSRSSGDSNGNSNGNGNGNANGHGFVKKGATDGQWSVMGVEQAREKVSQSLRDLLSGHYRSSLVAKKRSRKESNLRRIFDSEEEIVGSLSNNPFVVSTAKIRQLSDTLKKHCKDSNNNNNNNSLSDSDILKLMTETNSDILRQLKQDRTVQRKVTGQQSGNQQQQQQQQEEEEEKEKEEYGILSSSSPPSSCCDVDESLKRFQTDDEYLLLQQPKSKRRKK